MIVSLLAVGFAHGAERDDFSIKRENIFAFTEPPAVSRKGDKVTITFATSARCDVTVVLENRDGKIIRHLASGVLGDHAPPPLMANSLKQSIVWDGKDDQGAYVDNLDGVTARVSLGLTPKFEKVLFWEPKKRLHQDVPLTQATPEGVYVYDGRVFDHVRLYDHDGNYSRTVYPFPADKIAAVKGLHWRKFPQDGAELPLTEGFHQATFLSAGQNAGFDERLGIGVDVHNNYHGSVWGNAASVMAVRGRQIALAGLRLNRLATDGTSGGLDLGGPGVTFPIRPRGNLGGKTPYPVSPRSAAFSPDGKHLYLTGYIAAHQQSASRDIVLVSAYEWLPGVARVSFADGAKTEPFLGSMDLAESGTDNKHFMTPTSVAVDELGRVYVSDYVNDRVQVFSTDGQWLTTIPTTRPAQVSIHAKTQEVYVFSWYLPADVSGKINSKGASRPDLDEVKNFKSTLSVFAPLGKSPTAAPSKPTLTCPLKLDTPPSRSGGYLHRAELDSWSETPTIWLATSWGWFDILTRDQIRNTNIKLYSLQSGELVLKRDFHDDIKRSVLRTESPEYGRQRLSVDHANGHLYCLEGQAASGKSTHEAVRIDPETGDIKLVKLPFDAEDMCFDNTGLAYLRTFYVVARYDARTWREVPWDYGEQLDEVRTSSSRGVPHSPAASVLRLPVKMAGLHHHGGMSVSAKGNLVVAVNNHGVQPVNRKDVYDTPTDGGGKPYTPREFPGRVRWGEVHVWDKHGKLLFEDSIAGLNRTDGIAIDAHDHLYALSTATRVINGTPYFNDMTGTLIKVKPRAAKLLSDSDTAAVPLAEPERPKRPIDLTNSHVNGAWLDGAEWFYGGLGFSGKNAGRSGGGCDCYNARFALDYLGRSFAPEIGHHSVAVLDSNGNLILRIGKYGNADSAGPDSAIPLGGDEVGLFYAPYVATQTDRRVFIADSGNARIVSVTLGYHTTRRVPVSN